MNIIKKNIKDLNPAIYNPRKDLKPEDKEYQHIKNSIETFGYIDPIIFNKRNNVIIGGHQRYKVLKELGYKEIDCVEVDLEETEEKALNIALNKISGEWDFEALQLLLNDLDEELKNNLGLSFDDLDDLELESEEEKEIVEDEAPEPDFEKEPISKLGQIYKLGNHYLMCGDSTKEQDVKALMNDNKADMVFTDPPYNTGMTAKTDSVWLNQFFNDSYTDSEWEKFMSDFTNMYDLYTNDNCALYICLDWRRNYELIPHLKKHFKLSNTIVWDKVVHGLGSDYKYTYELINVCKKGNPVLNTHQGDREYQDVWHIQRKIGRDEDHATKKPIELVIRPIRHASKKRDIVLDLFGGSGSTLIACEQTERVCYMMELEPIYIDVIIKRWEDFTGKKAELIKDVNNNES